MYENKVYDGTKFLNDHPGGPESILIVAGQVSCCICSKLAGAFLHAYIWCLKHTRGVLELAEKQYVLLTRCPSKPVAAGLGIQQP